MPARASWKGHLRLSLVSFPVCLYNAISGSARVSMNQLHRGCQRRLKQQMICPEHGPVERGDIVKGYEYEKDKYVLIEEDDLEKIRIPTDRTIEITQFIDADEIDPLFFDAAYYVGPDGPMAEQAFRVVREAMRAENKIGIGRVVMSSREHVVALAVNDKGFLLRTLHSVDEVKAAGPYMESIRDGEIDADQLALARQLLASRASAYDASQFRDRYQDALLAMIRAKIEGTEPAVSQEAEVGQVINLMEALRQSLAQSPRKPAAASVKPAAKEKKARKRA